MTTRKSVSCIECGRELLSNERYQDIRGVILCFMCWEDIQDSQSRKRYLGPIEPGKTADRQYHGEQFSGGEW